MPKPTRTSVLIAGGGVAALEAALALRELADDLVDVELVAPEPTFWYRPTAVAEPFGLGAARHVDLSTLAAAAGALETIAALESVDVLAREAHLSNGAVVSYDVLLLACGGVPKPAVPGAVTFRGPGDTDAFAHVLSELEEGRARRLAFVVPWGSSWTLPAYELALMTALWIERRDLHDVEVALVTPEERPLELFGAAASEAVGELLDDSSIALHTQSSAAEFADGSLRLLLDEPLPADLVVALPRIFGQRIDGIAQTVDCFVATDVHGRVEGADRVYAAGDITAFPVKQGGLATQQADAAAESIAALAGADLTPQPFEPVLRGLLLTGSHPRYLRRDLAAGDEETAWVSETPIWWPPTKLVGRRLSPFLAELAGLQPPVEPQADAVRVEVRLRPDAVERDALALLGETGRDDDAPPVSRLMSSDPLVVAPEDTLGEVAERMRRADVGSALVTDAGRLIGILTARDLLRALAARVHSSEARVRQWMTADPVTIAPDASADEARFLMAHHGIHHLPVVDGGRPIGMVGLRAVTRSTAQLGPAIGLGF